MIQNRIIATMQRLKRCANEYVYNDLVSFFFFFTFQIFVQLPEYSNKMLKMGFLRCDWISRNLIFVCFLISVGHSHTPDSTIFTDQWAVHVIGGESVADAIAAKHGFTNLGKVRNKLNAKCLEFS